MERELTEAEALILADAVAAGTAFQEAVERLNRAFEAVVLFNLRERSRLESELANDDGSD